MSPTVQVIGMFTLAGIMMLGALGARNKGTVGALVLALVLAITAALLLVIGLFTLLDGVPR
jgi:hypothetical protein